MPRTASAAPPTPGGLCADLAITMSALLRLIEEEAEHVRAGKLFAAAQLKAQESALVRRYGEAVAALESRMGEVERAVPEQLAAVKREHQAFRLMLQINLAALATARELSDLRLKDLAGRVGAGRRKPDAPSAPLADSA